MGETFEVVRSSCSIGSFNIVRLFLASTSSAVLSCVYFLWATDFGSKPWIDPSIFTFMVPSGTAVRSLLMAGHCKTHKGFCRWTLATENFECQVAKANLRHCCSGKKSSLDGVQH